MKRCIIFAGINGAGKTYLYELKKNEFKNFYRQELAGEEAKKNIESFINKGVDFCLETSLSDISIVELIKKSKRSGYFVEIYYVLIRNEEKAINRVKNRVRLGGHNIDDDEIRIRFKKSIKNLFLLGDYVDKLVFYDNNDKPIIIAEYDF